MRLPGWISSLLDRRPDSDTTPLRIDRACFVKGVEAHLLGPGDYVVFRFDPAMPREEIERRAQTIAGHMPEGVRMIFAAGVEHINVFRPVPGQPAPEAGA